jgi:hypothetical protein
MSDLTGFWAAIDRQLTELTRAGTAADVLNILATEGNPYGDPHISSAPAFFAGGGGDGAVMGSLLAAGWRVTWSEASYYWTMTAPDGSQITYCEGDVWSGGRTRSAG